jgi:hypothetical protein
LSLFLVRLIVVGIVGLLGLTSGCGREWRDGRDGVLAALTGLPFRDQIQLSCVIQDRVANETET